MTTNPTPTVLEMDWGLSLEDERLEAAVAADGSHECELVHTPCGSYCEICEMLGGSFVKSRRR